jgi:hypothetical protein
MPINLVSIFEYEFFDYYDNSIFKAPIKGELKVKKNNMDILLINYLV